MEALECFWRLFFCCPRKGSPLPGTRIIQTIAHELKEFAYPEAWMIAALETQLIGFSTPLTELAPQDITELMRGGGGTGNLCKLMRLDKPHDGPSRTRSEE